MTQTLDIAAVAARISTVTGHRVGTKEHEATMNRVVVELALRDVAAVRDDARNATTVLTRDEFLIDAGVDA